MRIALALLAAAVATASGYEPTTLDLIRGEPRVAPATPGIVALEAGGALVGGALTALGAAAIAAQLDPVDDIEWSFFGGLERMATWGPPGAVLGCAAGAWAIGGAFRQEGKFWPALGGALAGGLVSFACMRVALATGAEGPWDEIAVPLALAAPPAGAVLAYNISRPCYLPGCSLRAGLPAVAWRESEPALDWQLVTLEF